MDTTEKNVSQTSTNDSENESFWKCVWKIPHFYLLVGGLCFLTIGIIAALGGPHYDVKNVTGTVTRVGVTGRTVVLHVSGNNHPIACFGSADCGLIHTGDHVQLQKCNYNALFDANTLTCYGNVVDQPS